jgi:hypothetical protein
VQSGGAHEQFLADLRRFLDDPAATEDGAVALLTERVKREVLYDVVAGTVPEEVSCFADLHDHVDANGYGGAFLWTGDFRNEHCTRLWNRVQDGVDAWLRGGGHR